MRLVVVSFRPPPGQEDTTENVEAVISSLQLDYPDVPMSVLQVGDSAYLFSFLLLDFNVFGVYVLNLEVFFCTLRFDW